MFLGSVMRRVSVPASLLVASTLTATLASPPTTCEKNPDFKMPYRMLGNTGLQVSVLSYGFWATFGDKDDLKKDSGVEMAKACLRKAREYGVNLFDNAEVYGTPYGEAESIMGQAIEELVKEDPKNWRRSDILITTKIFWGGEGVNERGLSRKHVMEGLDASLKRLRVSHVDLVFCHRPDPFTPTETVVRVMTEAVIIDYIPSDFLHCLSLSLGKIWQGHGLGNIRVVSSTDHRSHMDCSYVWS